jgi:hypothetical protein
MPGSKEILSLDESYGDGSESWIDSGIVMDLRSKVRVLSFGCQEQKGRRIHGRRGGSID